MLGRFSRIKSVLYALKNSDCKMRGDIFYEVKYWDFFWGGGGGVQSHCGLYWNEVSDKLAKQGAMKDMSETPYNDLLLSSREVTSILEKIVYKQTEKKFIWDTFLSKIFSKSNIQVTSKFMEH